MQQPNYLIAGTEIGGRYIITSHLGGGGFGQTYLAEDHQLPGNPQCVVKQFKPQLTDPGALQIARRLFDTEAEVLYKLGHHSHIPRLLAHFEENKEFFLVQEFIEGHELDEELAPGKKLNEAEVTSIILEILEILSFVHRENVIHRDIKPSNIIRRKNDNKLVLIDFGAVKQISIGSFVSSSQKQTALTVAIGTPGYMPNEQSIGKPRFSSDVYAVGVIGIQALTGLSPHQFREDPVTGEIVWHDQVQASPKLMEFLDRMVRYDFRERFASAIEALQSFQAQGNHFSVGQGSHHNIPPTLPSPLPYEQTHQLTQVDNPTRQLSDFQKILLLGGIVGASIVGGLIVTRTPQPQIADQPNIPASPQVSSSPILSPSPTPEPSRTPQTLQSGDSSSGTQPNLHTVPSQIPEPSSSPRVTIPTTSPANSPFPSSQGWEFLGSASTGEAIYVDNSSIRNLEGEIQFTYKIGDDLISATADCSSNRWYVNGHGWYSPQSQATQSMLNYVCRF